MSRGAIIRLARPDDAVDILEIYAPCIRDTAITFEKDVPSQGEIVQRVEKIQERHVWLVCEYEGKVIGYAYSGQHRAREAYIWATEVSVYVREQFRSMGVARALYTVLLRVLQLQGYALALAGMTLPNRSSAELHHRMGFERFARYEKVGYKFNQWHTTEWWRKDLLDLTSYSPESHPKPITEVVGSEGWKSAIESGLVHLHINV